MKCVLSKEALLNGLQIVQNVVTSRTTLPILGNALIEAGENEIVVSTTDLDTGIRATIEADVKKPGATTLPAKRLVNIVRELPSSELELEVDGKHQASIRSGASFFKIMGLPEEDFPAFPKAEDAKLFRIKQGEFKEMLRRTAYAISTDESRYVLNGELLCFKEGKLTIVATDGRRLALTETEMEFPQSSECEVILPTKAVQELQRILKGDEDMQILLSENQIAFDLGSIFLTTKLIEGNYPNYKQVIPTETKMRVNVERELLLNAAHRVALLSSDKSNSVKLSFSKNNLEIMANTPEVGEARENLPVDFDGEEFEIAFNPGFLMDPLRNLDSDEIHFDFIDDLSPGIIRYNQPFLYVLMPMRTS